MSSVKNTIKYVSVIIEMTTRSHIVYALQQRKQASEPTDIQKQRVVTTTGTLTTFDKDENKTASNMHVGM